jgi:hypothetical protein
MSFVMWRPMMGISSAGNNHHILPGKAALLCSYQFNTMNKTGIILLIACALLLPSCITTRIVTSWKTEQSTAFPYHKIMVAAIVNEENDSLRLIVEKQVAAKLNAMGYYAVSTAEEFGRYGLEQLGEEATYLSLCDNGIDAVLTIALVPESKSADMVKAAGSKYTSAYYYKHIWSYRDIKQQAKQPKEQLKWEMILFDVTQLKPQSVQQAGPFPGRQAKIKIVTLAERALAQLIKERILLPKDTVPARKPF